MKKFIFLVSHPIQYYSPLFREIEKHDGIDLEVLYCSDENVEGHIDKGFGVKVRWDIPLLEGYNYKFLKNNSWKPSVFNGFFGLLNFQIFNELKKEKGSYIILHSWVQATTYLAIIAAKLHGVKLCLRAENPLNQELMKPPPVLFLRRVFFQYFFFRLFDYFFYIGELNKKLYKYYGVKEDKLVFTPYAVDNERYQNEYLQYKDKKTELRSYLELPHDKIIILFAGKYIEKKRPMMLLEVFRSLSNDKTALVFLGDGELRNKIESYIQKYSLKNVFLTGFKNQTEVGKYFASADIFVLPSGAGETWGLVVNEAMNFALPVIVSDIAGCSSDLVAGDNGFVFKTHEELIKQLNFLVNNPEQILQKGRVSLKRISDYNYDKIVKNLLKI